MTRPYFSLSLALAVCLLPASPGWALSIQEAQRQMQENSSQAKANEWELAQWQERQQAVRWLHAPRVEANLVALAYEKDLSGYRDAFTQQLDGAQADALAANPSFSGSGIHEQQGVRSQLSVQWPLYTGGRIAATKSQASWRYEQARAEQQWQWQMMNRELIERYFTAQLTQQVLSIRAESLEVLEQHSHRASRLRDEGMISSLQAMQAQVARDQAHRHFREAQRNAADALAALATLMGTYPESCLSTPLQWSQVGTGHLAEQQHPALAAMASVEKQAQAQVRIEQSQWKPELFGFASMELNRDMAPIHEPDWAVGLGLRWQISTGINRQAMVRSAYAQQAQAEAMADHHSRELDFMAELAMNRYRFTQEQKQLMDSERAFVAEQARMQQAAFEQGQATVLDVNDAILQVSVVELEHLQLQHQHLLALADWLLANGQLDRFFDQQTGLTLTHFCQE